LTEWRRRLEPHRRRKMLAPPPAEFSTARRLEPARQPDFTAASRLRGLICLLRLYQIQVQQLQYQLDNVEGELENMNEQKLKNRADLLARQQKTKYYQKVGLWYLDLSSLVV